MPLLTENTVRALVHCTDALCPGYEQEEVDAIAAKTDLLFTDFGGDIPGVERSFTHMRFVHDGRDELGHPDPDAPDDSRCPHCSKLREFGEERRREYQNLSGHDPLGLLRGLKFIPGLRNSPEDARVAELEAAVRRLETPVTPVTDPRIAELEATVARLEKTSKPTPAAPMADPRVAELQATVQRLEALITAQNTGDAPAGETETPARSRAKKSTES